MKIKKLLVLVSMLAVMFSLAGCDENKEKPFAYDDTQIVLDTMSYFISYAGFSEDYYDYYLSDGNEFEQSAIKGIKQAKETDKVGEFDDYSSLYESIAYGYFTPESVEAEIVNSDDSVSVTIINSAANRDVEVTIKYIENPEFYMQYNETMESCMAYYESYYGYTEASLLAEAGASSLDELFGNDIISELNSSGLYPYIPEEMVVSAVYSKSELMGQAGMNTLIGMGTVFVVLIFISFIISLFKYLPALVAKKPKVEVESKKVAPAPVAKAPAATTKDENLVNDAELVAVITAAIYAAAGQAGNGAVSKDKLVVRSIKRVKR